MERLRRPLRIGIALIGMTNLGEAKCAREAEIAYATAAMVTDYDSWNEAEEAVSQEAIGRIMRDNAARARAIIPALVDAVAPRPAPRRRLPPTAPAGTRPT